MSLKASAWVSNHPLFRSLSSEEVAQFRSYSLNNPAPTKSTWDITHPVCRIAWLAVDKMPSDATEPPEHLREEAESLGRWEPA